MQAISTPHPQISNTLLLVVPRDFSFNEETALDNEFQSNPSLEKAKLLEAVLKEFYDSVKILRDAGITVLDIDKNDDISLLVDKTPDSIFPNNWLSTSSDGRIYVYHMFAANRRLETKLLPLVEKTLKNNGFKYNEVIEIKGDSDEFLEGTGSMIFNKVNRSIYAAISLRTNEKILKKYAEITGENIISFHTKSSKNMPFYHTNIMLCIGEGFAKIRSESISDETERKNVLENLKASSLKIIEISLEQVCMLDLSKTQQFVI